MWNPFAGNEASEWLDKSADMYKQYYSPYVEAGQRSIPTLEEQYQILLNNPQAMQELLGGGYEQSPGYQYQYDSAMNGVNSAAAMGGALGTQSHQQQAGRTAQGLTNQDYWNYYDANSDLYNKGLSGTRDLYTGGLNATNSLTSGLGNVYGSQADLSSSQYESMMKALGKSLAMGKEQGGWQGALTAGLGGVGAVFGGPAGALLGSYGGQTLGNWI
jgi:hypothetical protein